jgi:hypothetical protein
LKKGIDSVSVYDHRDRPAYSNFSVKRSYCRNPHILKWWTSEHDQLIIKQIGKEQWLWYWGITDEIIKITPQETIDAWQKADPLCSKYAWYSILMYFAASRAESLGFTKQIRKPKWKACPLCKQRFVEDSLPAPLVARLGIDHTNFCAPCLSDALFQGSESLSEEQVLTYLRDLSDVLQRVPHQNFGEGIEDLRGLDFEERLALLQVLKRKPTVRRVKELFGSWLKALVEAGILEDGTRQTSRGTHCLAKDGHVCLSLGEKTIDDFLHNHGIGHEKEPHYPEGNFRGDFLVDSVFIEYFGLKGNPDYDVKIRLKQRLCKKHGIKLVAIYPSDLVSLKKLEGKLLGELSQSS